MRLSNGILAVTLTLGALVTALPNPARAKSPAGEKITQAKSPAGAKAKNAKPALVENAGSTLPLTTRPAHPRR